jgi:hypothetical protein
MIEAKFLFELPLTALDPLANLAVSTGVVMGKSGGNDVNQYLLGPFSPAGH